MLQPPPLTPLRSILTWLLSALAGAAGLVVGHGFREPIVADPVRLLHILLGASLGLFALSRVLMLVPASALRARLERWWVDFVLLIAAGIWWVVDRDQGSLILHIGAVYCLAIGTAAIARAGFDALVEGLAEKAIGRAGRRLALAALGLALIGGGVLTLPVSWRGTYPSEADPIHAAYYLQQHWVDCTFTATAALTGTGLSVHDVGYAYSRFGQIVILVIMQVGGLAILGVGAALGLRFRQMVGWGGADDDLSPAGVRRVIRFTWVLALLLEAAGTAAVYRMWDAELDPNFGTTLREPPVLAGLVERVPGLEDRYDEGRLLASVFHAVSAFCNVGLALPRDGLIVYRNQAGVYGVLLPLMLLGSLGGPVVYEGLCRLLRRGRMGLGYLSKDSAVTLLGTVLLVVVVGVLLAGIESTPQWQLRYPQENTPGRLILPGSAEASPASLGPTTTQLEAGEVIEFRPDESDRTRAYRLATMGPMDRWAAAGAQAVTARGGGIKLVRLDESSISPASHLALMAAMAVGGGLGGAAGGLRLPLVALLMSAVLLGGRSRRRPPMIPPVGEYNRGFAIAAAVATGMLLLLGVASLVLIYREPASPSACAFEAASAVFNVGLSSGMTSQLSVVSKVTLSLAMLLGRLLPLVVLLRLFLPIEPMPTRPLIPPRPKAEDEASAPAN